MNLYKNKKIQTINKLFPVSFIIVCALLFTANQLCIIAGVIWDARRNYYAFDGDSNLYDWWGNLAFNAIFWNAFSDGVCTRKSRKCRDSGSVLQFCSSPFYDTDNYWCNRSFSVYWLRKNTYFSADITLIRADFSLMVWIKVWNY